MKIWGAADFPRIWYMCSINFRADWYMTFSAQDRRYQIGSELVLYAEIAVLIPNALIYSKNAENPLFTQQSARAGARALLCCVFYNSIISSYICTALMLSTSMTVPPEDISTMRSKDPSSRGIVFPPAPLP